MYGIIHNAVRSTVLLHADEAIWSDILAQAELTDQHFLSPANYSDEITFRMIDTVAAALKLSRAEVLCLAGRHWCDFSIAAGYGSLFSMAGQNLGDFLANLDRMHNSLNVALVEASMPSFELTRSDAQGFEIIYRSQREGLAPFVEGILHGLFRHYGEPMTMRWEEKGDGAYFILDRIIDEVGLPTADNGRAKTASLTDRTAA
ncbi:MAG: heme NO-binding domain-containing protein [Litorimonas sp.]